MSRTTKPIAIVLLSLSTAAALTACDSGKTSSVAAVPTWPSTASTTPAGDGDSSALPAIPPSSSSTSVTPTSTESPPSAKPTPVAEPSGGKCAPSALSGTLVPGSPGAGQRYASLIVTNTSGASCTLYGYSGLQLIGADGSALPTRLDRTPNPGPRLVVLAPGRQASAELHWSAVPGPGESQSGQCQPTPVRAEVIPPDDYSPITVSWHSGPVCDGGRVNASAFH